MKVVLGAAPSALAVVLALAGSAGLGAGCSSFGSEEEETPAPVDSGVDAGPVDSGGGCGAFSPSKPAACGPSCTAAVLYPKLDVIDAVAVGTELFTLHPTNVMKAVPPANLVPVIPITGPTSIASDGTHIYVRTDTGLRRARVSDSGFDDLNAVKSLVGDLAIGSVHVFVMAEKKIYRARKDDPSSMTPDSEVIVFDRVAGAIAAHADDAYWISRSGTTSKMAVHGPFPATNVTIGEAQDPRALAVDASYVYVADQRAGSFAILRISRTAKTTEQIATEPGVVQRMAVSGGALYWSADRGGAESVVLVRQPTCGGEPKVLASGLSGLGGLSFAGGKVYAASAALKQVYAIAE